jgi:hypothetical protein
LRVYLFHHSDRAAELAPQSGADQIWRNQLAFAGQLNSRPRRGNLVGRDTVERQGFEPRTPRSQSECSSLAELALGGGVFNEGGANLGLI